MKMIRKEFKERFILELTSSEKLFFLKRAREAIAQKGYPAGEALFHYCYFLTLRERMCKITSGGGEGYVRFLLVEGKKEIEEAIKLYEERLEKKKLPVPDTEGSTFIEYFSS